MTPIRYHPLIDADTSGAEKTPLFAVEDRKPVREHHSLWLEEISPANYWLISKESMKKEAAEKLLIHCPLCGKIMESVCTPLDEHQLSLYRCRECGKRNGGKTP